MKNGNTITRPRNEYRSQAPEHLDVRKPFVSAVAVRLHVSEEQAVKLGKSVKKGINKASREKAVPWRFAKDCEVVVPEKMCVIMVERGKLIESIRKESARRGESITIEKQRQLQRVAAILKQRLDSLVAQADTDIQFEFGNSLVPVDENVKPRMLGVPLQGWRGAGRSYPEINADGTPSSLPIFSKLAQTCVATLVDNNVPVTQEFLATTGSATPTIGVVWHPKGFKVDTVRSLRPYIAESVHGRSAILDTRVLTHTDPTISKSQELEVLGDGRLVDPTIEISSEIDGTDLFVPFGYAT